MAQSAQTFEIVSTTTGQTFDFVYSEEEAQKRTENTPDRTYISVWHSPTCYCDSMHHLHAY